MKRTIYKYRVDDGSIRFSHVMPELWGFLHVDIQDGAAFFWAEVDANSPKKEVQFLVVGTGWEIDDYLTEKENAFYLGTWLSGGYVWHLYRLALV